MATIKELKFDDKNFNKHTEFGMSLLEKSLRENGAGRSILIDKDNNIIAGNGIIEAAGQIGLENVRVVESDGSEIIAVKRTDISLDSEKGRTMALADNATAMADLEWDEELVKLETEKWGINVENWGISFDEIKGELLNENDLSEETFLSSYYTKKQDVDRIEFDRTITVDERYENLKNLANSCENIELQKLLKRRLKDFVDFNFDYIADYYLSGANKKEKELLEAFGLVIPSEKNAFLNKFLDLEREVVLG